MSVSPSDAVDVETSSEVVEQAGNHADVEGASKPKRTSSESTSSSNWVTDALFSTEPNPSLSEVESPFNPSEGGITRIYRGLQKMTGSDAMPAIVDVAIGVLEVQLGGNPLEGLTPDAESDQTDEQGSGDIDVVEQEATA